MKIINRLICRIMGHKRAKRITEMVRDDAGNERPLTDWHQYRCPRCGTTWTRKITPRRTASGNTAS